MMQRTNPNRSARPGPNAFVGQEGPGHGWSRKLPGEEYAPDEMFQKCTHVAEREWDSYLLHCKLDFYNQMYEKQAEEVAQPQQKKRKIDVDVEHPAALKKFDCRSLIDAGTGTILVRPVKTNTGYIMEQCFFERVLKSSKGECPYSRQRLSPDCEKQEVLQNTIAALYDQGFLSEEDAEDYRKLNTFYEEQDTYVSRVNQGLKDIVQSTARDMFSANQNREFTLLAVEEVRKDLGSDTGFLAPFVVNTYETLKQTQNQSSSSSASAPEPPPVAAQPLLPPPVIDLTNGADEADEEDALDEEDASDDEDAIDHPTEAIALPRRVRQVMPVEEDEDEDEEEDEDGEYSGKEEESDSEESDSD